MANDILDRLIITYFKLIVNQNLSENLYIKSGIITYFKLIVKLRQFLSSKILYINTGDVLKRGKYE